MTDQRLTESTLWRGVWFALLPSLALWLLGIEIARCLLAWACQ